MAVTNTSSTGKERQDYCMLCYLQMGLIISQYTLVHNMLGVFALKQISQQHCVRNRDDAAIFHTVSTEGSVTTNVMLQQDVIRQNAALPNKICANAHTGQITLSHKRYASTIYLENVVMDKMDKMIVSMITFQSCKSPPHCCPASDVFLKPGSLEHILQLYLKQHALINRAPAFFLTEGCFG